MIESLWREHEAAPFPTASRCREVAGHDLIALDDMTAGCVSTFLTLGMLDPSRFAVLGLCDHGLALVVAGLEGEDRASFGRLETLAGLVLEAVRDGRRSA